jgi:CheY-like chemotaxis protein
VPFSASFLDRKPCRDASNLGLIEGVVRAIVYHYPRFRALSLALEAGGDEQDLELPPGVEGGYDGEWVEAEFHAGEQSVRIPACIVDRGYGLRLGFEEREWQCLWTFANTNDAPSVLPPTVPPPSAESEIPREVRVLVVDADKDVQRMLSLLLKSEGYTPVVTSSAEEAASRLREAPFELVLLDSKLPEANGLELCKWIRRDGTLSRLPVVFVSGRSASADLVAAFEAGADDFVGKPFRPPELKARIRGVLRRSQMPAYAATRAG